MEDIEFFDGDLMDFLRLLSKNDDGSGVGGVKVITDDMGDIIVDVKSNLHFRADREEMIAFYDVMDQVNAVRTDQLN